MPDALPLTGLFGKVPAHGDFVRRGLPTSFVGPWDSWLQDGMATARERLGDRWAGLWDGAPPWRFALPAGACGPDAVAGVILPSEDMVGRRFPITLAALLPAGDTLPGPAWFAALEAAALAGRAGQADADALAAAIPLPHADLGNDPWPSAVSTDPPPLPFAVGPAVGDLLDMFSDAMPVTTTVQDARPPPADASPPLGASALLDLFSGTPAGEPATALFMPMTEPPGTDSADVLDMLGAAVAPAAQAPSDGTLAFLLGEATAEPGDPEARAASASDAAPEPVAGSGDEADPLAALIAAGDGPLGAAAPLPQAALFPAAFNEDTDPAPLPALAAEAPEPPAGGGWWTGGGGRLPPSIRTRPALLTAAEFASLLEADA